jgi:hypothetical protein
VLLLVASTGQGGARLVEQVRVSCRCKQQQQEADVCCLIA